MANRVTSEDIVRINESYYKNKTYAAAARETGFSAGTVKKYVIPGWEPTINENIQRFDINSVPQEVDYEAFRHLDTVDLGKLTVEEKTEMEELWKELAV